MPQINQEKIIEKILTNNGEVTINLNLTISVVKDGEIVVTARPEAVQEAPKQAVKEKPLVIVPDEVFELDIPVVQDFGRK